MDYIYNSYEDRYAGCAVLYTKPGPNEHYIYVDKECTEIIDGPTLKDLFYKGLIIEEI